MDTIIPRHKWNILRCLGCFLPRLTCIQRTFIRKQLKERYCATCGEYIYNPFKRRKIRHYHYHQGYKYKYIPILCERLVLYPSIQLVEWTRRFPNVMRLIISEKDMYFYNTMKPRYTHRIPAMRLWSMEEWNLMHPDIPLRADTGMKRIVQSPTHDPMFTPGLVI